MYSEAARNNYYEMLHLYENTQKLISEDVLENLTLADKKILNKILEKYEMTSVFEFLDRIESLKTDVSQLHFLFSSQEQHFDHPK